MIYLASPYSHKDPLIMKTRFFLAEQVTASLLDSGRYVYSPIVHCHEIAWKYSLRTDFDFWQGYNRDMIRRCDTLMILDIVGWKESKGVRGEYEFAQLCGFHPQLINADGRILGELTHWPA